MSDDVAHLLIVDDDEGIRKQLRWALDEYRILEASDHSSALAAIRGRSIPVVILDLGLPPDQDGPSEGFRVLDDIITATPDTKVIVMTGQTDRAYALKAVSSGAYDFYEKPPELDALSLIVSRAARLHDLEQENQRLSANARLDPLPGVVSADPAMLQVCEEVRRFAASDITILLVGESGTGKEVLARAIHSLSDRSEAPYVAMNCAAVPEALLESEVFGHEKGAFTGAHKSVIGKAELANKGTLLLDEIGDLPLALQAKLLRFLQERVIERLGGRRPIPVDIRVISATNRDPRQLIEEGMFREDLYYRLSEAVVEIPPLRSRPGDTIAIARHLVEVYAREKGKTVRGFTPRALTALASYRWPGNVRELENRIKRALVTTSESRIDVNDLALPNGEGQAAAPGPTQTLREARECAERSVVESALAEADGNISKAAKILDTSRPTLYQLLKQYKLRD